MVPQLTVDGQAWSTDDMRTLVAGLSARLRGIGVSEGDTVAAMLRNGPVHVALAVACRQAGVYLVEINWHFKSAEASYLLADSRAAALVVNEDLLTPIATAIGATVHVISVPENDAGEPPGSPARAALLGDGAPLPPRSASNNSIFYTSGTTGRPKGVRRLPVGTDACASIEAAQREVHRTVFGVTEASRALLSAPMYHSSPLAFVLNCCANAAVLVLESRFQAERTLGLIEQHRITEAYLVPTMFQRLLALSDAVRTKYDLSSLRHISSTGSPCPADTKRRMIDWFGPIVTEGYGATETGFVTFIDSADWLRRPGSAGRPVGNAKLRIVDESGATLPAGQIGLIYARQPAMPDFEYLGHPTAREQIEADGLVTAGDIGYVDDAGYLFICDRQSDLVISGGVNIYPAEVEAELLTMPGIADVAVFGIPDVEFGESLAAAVQMQAGTRATPSEVQAYLGDRLASFKVPKTIVFHERLPRDESGKIFKRRLRDDYWQGHARRI
ncbi:AMP-binding protein [Variovorax sp. M-6]|uniref:AMP-binding protein n=1 Tax=Variovorax sp. M-6 TaxID=3233041 RepID=UPI003F965D9A